MAIPHAVPRQSADGPQAPQTVLQPLHAGAGSDESALLARVARQDQQAFSILYRRYAPRVLGYLMRSLAPPELSDEVLQDVMLVLWQRAAQVPPHVPLIAWLSGVARHKALKARARMGTPAVVPTAPESLDYEEPEAVALRREHLLMLTAALDRLPRSERMALELLAYQECSPQEIAMQTGVPVSTVRTWVSRARQRLRAYVSVI